MGRSSEVRKYKDKIIFLKFQFWLLKYRRCENPRIIICNFSSRTALWFIPCHFTAHIHLRNKDQQF